MCNYLAWAGICVQISNWSRIIFFSPAGFHVCSGPNSTKFALEMESQKLRPVIELHVIRSSWVGHTRRVSIRVAGALGGTWVVKATGAYRYKIVYTEHCTRPKVYIKVSDIYWRALQLWSPFRPEKAYRYAKDYQRRGEPLGKPRTDPARGTPNLRRKNELCCRMRRTAATTP